MNSVLTCFLAKGNCNQISAVPVQSEPTEKPSGGFSFNDNSNTLDNQTPESGDPRFDPSAKPLTEDDLPF